MKRLLPLLLAALFLLSSCASDRSDLPPPTQSSNNEFSSRFSGETTISLSDSGVTWSTPAGVPHSAVTTDHNIIYYQDRLTYESGNPYGEGNPGERHTAEEAAAHTVVRITQPGAYRITGKLSAGQICIDLGEDAYEDPNAVVELILDGAEITCSVAPAILFLNVYECDGDWSAETARPDVDTSAAGANLILAENSRNTVTGSHVAKIYKDKDGEKKLWKQDGAVYSYMSMNIYGPGVLELTADNEGLGTELHLTINGGDIVIRSNNDGINTNEDGVSVTTVNGGGLRILAGLGAEGDGIDSNGYLVINGGTVFASANPAADAGLDSDLGSYINGGTVVALGTAMDWTESDSRQVTMNLQFAQYQTSGASLSVASEDGNAVFSFDPASDPVLGENPRAYQGAILSCPVFQVGDCYYMHIGGIQMMYTGTDVMGRGPGGMGGGFGGQRPQDGAPGNFDGQQPPEGFDGEIPTMPEGETIPGGFPENPGQPPEGAPPGGFGGFGGPGENSAEGQPGTPGQGSALFYMQDKVNFFFGLQPTQ